VHRRLGTLFAVSQYPPVTTAAKVRDLADLGVWRDVMRAKCRRVVVTNGCFDLLHVGHIAYLEEARSLGDALIVGVNGDESVRQLKGPGRPINSEGDRARVLAALECVSVVCLFGEKRATRFLSIAAPDIWVKGGDYTLESVNPEERLAVEGCGGRIFFIPFVAGKSTTQLVGKLNRAE